MRRRLFWRGLIGSGQRDNSSTVGSGIILRLSVINSAIVRNKPAMKPQLFVGLLMLFALRATAQEHAPTLDQCRADRDLWTYQIPKGSTAHKELREHLAGINSHDLYSRQIEITNCMTAIDPMPDIKTDWTSVNPENFSATVVAHQQQLLNREKWDMYMLLRLVYAEEMEERLMALLESKK
jgi:hypothetical protein